MIVKKISGLLLFACTALLFVGCPKNPGVTPQPPVITDQDKCQAACANLQHLGCDEGNPIDMHTKCLITADCASGQTCSALGTCMVTCVQFCIDTENQGVWLDPACVASITSCSQIDQCPAAKATAPRACNEESCPMPVH